MVKRLPEKKKSTLCKMLMFPGIKLAIQPTWKWQSFTLLSFIGKLRSSNTTILYKSFKIRTNTLPVGCVATVCWFVSERKEKHGASVSSQAYCPIPDTHEVDTDPWTCPTGRADTAWGEAWLEGTVYRQSTGHDPAHPWGGQVRGQAVWEQQSCFYNVLWLSDL